MADRIFDENNIDSYNKFLIFPNPANDEVLVEFGQNKRPATISILNAIGSICYIETVLDNSSNSATINLKNLPVGMYWIAFFDGTEIKFKKLIIQRS